MTMLDEGDTQAVLQHAGAALLVALEVRSPDVLRIVSRVVTELQTRGWEGDEELAEHLQVVARTQGLPGRSLPVALDALEALLEGGEFDTDGGFLDLTTGEVVPSALTDPRMVGDDLAIDIEAEPDRWLEVSNLESRAAWSDMVAFADSLAERSVSERLRSATEGRGAFRRFRSEVDQAGVTDRWQIYATERKLGRARAWLINHGIHPIPGG